MRPDLDARRNNFGTLQSCAPGRRSGRAFSFMPFRLTANAGSFLIFRNEIAEAVDIDDGGLDSPLRLLRLAKAEVFRPHFRPHLSRALALRQLGRRRSEDIPAVKGAGRLSLRRDGDPVGSKSAGGAWYVQGAGGRQEQAVIRSPMSTKVTSMLLFSLNPLSFSRDRITPFI